MNISTHNIARCHAVCYWYGQDNRSSLHCMVRTVNEKVESVWKSVIFQSVDPVQSLSIRFYRQFFLLKYWAQSQGQTRKGTTNASWRHYQRLKIMEKMLLIVPTVRNLIKFIKSNCLSLPQLRAHKEYTYNSTVTVWFAIYIVCRGIDSNLISSGVRCNDTKFYLIRPLPFKPRYLLRMKSPQFSLLKSIESCITICGLKVHSYPISHQVREYAKMC